MDFIKKLFGLLVKLGFFMVALGGLFVCGLIAYAYVMDKLEEDDDEDFDFDEEFNDEEEDDDDFEDEDDNEHEDVKDDDAEEDKE
ncbi:MAG: hypothetical protein M0R46_05640 [Candidatus Muirbacterium halophilum]|nr:hypothetical protein [Candidatus Muirbacterium halophilum]MCK9475378.1 hypothetical protein [Candidatus Muirbacterium halophilum]